jgi:hypothetical protein
VNIFLLTDSNLKTEEKDRKTAKKRVMALWKSLLKSFNLFNMFADWYGAPNPVFKPFQLLSISFIQ